MTDLERCRAEQARCWADDRPGGFMGFIDWGIEAMMVKEERAAEYREFLKRKRVIATVSGMEVDPGHIHRTLYPFQRDFVTWALRKGRCAIWADTGLGKTMIQCEWARLVSQLVGGRVLIVAPLSVAQQTVREADTKLGLHVQYCREQSDAPPLQITNYEMIDRFAPAQFCGVVLDESSILKSLDGKTRKKLTDLYGQVPYRLCCTATPAPNDIAELANHAEFLGIMSRVDMLSSFFVHDSMKKNSEGWRLKKHATEPFFRWLASWSMSIRKPSDLGYSDAGYDLPPLDIQPLWVDSDWCPEGQLFPVNLHGLRDRISARRASIEERVNATVEWVYEQGLEKWLVWCGLNDEQDLLEAKFRDDCVSIRGTDSLEEKVRKEREWREGDVPGLVTKPSIFGWGSNWQHCHEMVFVGLNDSWETYYQAIRREWRFGQKHPVRVRVVLSHSEQPVFENIDRKERQASEMRQRLIANIQTFEREELTHVKADIEEQTEEASGEQWRLLYGDCVQRMAGLPDASVDLSVFSPPFLSLYTYSPTEQDVGNSRSKEEFFEHFRFVIDELKRITKPGRNCCVHVAQVPATLGHDGFIGLRDFRAEVVKEFDSHGWVYHGEVVIDKDPQAQAIRTHSKGLLFVQLRKDSSWLRPALADYILVFRAPGENAVPIQPDLTNDEWIEWARPIWYGIRETETLNVAEARENDDERHICPLQLGTIERCVRLWSNKGETVFSPFAGIGSEGYVAVQKERRFIGCELKRSYYDTAVKNLRIAQEGTNLPLFQNAFPEDSRSIAESAMEYSEEIA